MHNVAAIHSCIKQTRKVVRRLIRPYDRLHHHGNYSRDSDWPDWAQSSHHYINVPICESLWITCGQIYYWVRRLADLNELVRVRMYIAVCVGMLRIYIKDAHNHLTTSGKHLSWPHKQAHVLLVHHADHLADGILQRSETI